MNNTVSPCTVNDPTNGTPYTIDHGLLLHLVGGVRPLMVVRALLGTYIHKRVRVTYESCSWC